MSIVFFNADRENREEGTGRESGIEGKCVVGSVQNTGLGTHLCDTMVCTTTNNLISSHFG